MAAISRREFLQKTATNAAVMSLVAAHVARLKASPLGLPLGSQTYPHRTRILCGDFVGLLKDMKAIGIEVIELCDPFNYADFKPLTDGRQTRKILDDNGMKAVSAHFGMGVLRTRYPECLQWAQDIGMTMMCTADLGGRVTNGTTSEDEVKRAAYEYNRIAENTKKAGLQQILHNEGFANSRLEDGRLTYPVLLDYLDHDLVKMQFQMSSMTTVGNPITYFTNHPGRFISAHLQGVNTAAGMRAVGPAALPVKSDASAAGGRGAGAGRGGGGGRAGGAPADPCAAGRAAPAPAAPAAAAAPAAGAQAGAPALPGGGGGGQMALGEDTADWPAIFAAAKIGGLKYAFIEQSWDLTVKSAAYLKTLT